MKSLADQSVMTLNALIEVNKNAEKGFREAAEDVQNPYYEFQLNEQARHRASYARELQNAIVLKFEETPKKKGTVAGALHRSWINLKASLNQNDQSILKECLRGDELAKKSYRESLNDKLPPAIIEILQRHYEGISENCKHLKAHIEKN